DPPGEVQELLAAALGVDAEAHSQAPREIERAARRDRPPPRGRRRCAHPGRVDDVPPAYGPVTHLRRDLPEVGETVVTSRRQVITRKRDAEVLPARALAVEHHELVATLERLLDCGERMLGRTVQLPIGAPQHPKGVVVETEPDMQSML